MAEFRDYGRPGGHHDIDYAVMARPHACLGDDLRGIPRLVRRRRRDGRRRLKAALRPAS